MREIKFRAWDRNNNRMVHVGDRGWRSDHEFINTFGELIDSFEDEDLMQFTGLKDKDGREIYEEDIVKEGDHFGVIYFKSPGFIVCDKDGEWLLGNNTLYPDGSSLVATEVIGNIRDNPELTAKVV